MFRDLLIIIAIGFGFSVLTMPLAAIALGRVRLERSNRLRAVILVVVPLLCFAIAGVLANYLLGQKIGEFNFDTSSDCTVSQLQLPASSRNITMLVDYDAEWIRFQSKKRFVVEWLEDIDRFGKLDGVKTNQILVQKYPANDATFYSLFKTTGWSQSENLLACVGQPSELHAWYDRDNDLAYIYVARW